MGPTYVFSPAEILGEVQESLKQHLGSPVFNQQLYGLLDSALDILLHGQTWCPMGSPIQILQSWYINAEDASEISERLHYRLEIMVKRIVGDRLHEWDDLRLNHQITQQGDVQLSWLMGTATDQTPPPSPNDFLAKIRQGIENGDWYPENIRRLVGW